MDRTLFESQARKEGYKEPLEREMAANLVNPTHTHEFDAQLLILGGEMTILRDGAAHIYRQGDTCEVPAGTVHEERVGPEGVRYLAARRHTRAAG
jgi:quercetin dioxygenase-like cupin family protein